METKEAYKKNLDAQLNEWIAQIKLLDAKAEKAEAGERRRYLRDLDVLHAKRREVSRKMKELETAGDDAWEKVKVTADDVWNIFRKNAAKSVSSSK